MKPEKYFGHEKVLHEALVAARGVKVLTDEDRIAALERKLETSRLTNTEVAEIQKQIKQLRSR
ncbi:MAG: hypothetical protein NTY60_00345 [Proteobacteria bacterium]|nr:hypothetical protein [Pseudomonadota bacterium]